MKRKVVITGIGLITPIGNNKEETWNSALKGVSGTGLINKFDTSGLQTKIAAQVKNFQPELILKNYNLKRIDKFIQYGLVASEEAIQDSKLDIQNMNSDRIGVAVGTGLGGISFIEQNNFNFQKKQKTSPFFIPGCMHNMLSGYIAIKNKISGANYSVSSACATGLQNIIFATNNIAYGDADIMIAGGSEMATTPLIISGFNAAKALSTNNENPETASKPWDKERDGFVIGEGAGVVILEEYEHALKRNANIYAEVAGSGLSSDNLHATSPSKEGVGAAKAIQKALINAEIKPDKIDYIVAHGTSTKLGDAAETEAIHQVFDKNLDKVIVTGVKSMTGHMLGAAGAAELALSALSLKNQIGLPTINTKDIDENCRLNILRNNSKKININYTLNNSFGFGGTNSSLILKK